MSATRSSWPRARLTLPVLLSSVPLVLGLAMLSVGLLWWPPAAGLGVDASTRRFVVQRPAGGRVRPLDASRLDRNLVLQVPTQATTTPESSRRPIAAMPPHAPRHGEDPLSPPWDRHLGDQSGAVARTRVSTTGPWRTPLSLQSEVTLWDQIQVSADTDPQAYLFGIAIQLFTPQAAATPGPIYNPFP